MPPAIRTNVAEVASIIRQARNGVAFIIGAGCSLSAGIPLAKQLLVEANRTYSTQIDQIVPPDKRDNYGACMAALTPEERKALLRPYLSKARINWAHIAIACMMNKGFIARALTLNFDPILARACGLVGLYPATYDFGVAPSNKVEFLSSPSIIHLHGQGYGPVMMNAEDETLEQAERLDPLIEATLSRYNLIVVGYSGSADMIFPRLMSNYRGVNRIFWLGYESAPEVHLNEMLAGKFRNFCRYIGECDADTTMIELAQKLDCFPPQIVVDPAQHLLNELENVCKFPLSNTSTTTDILEDVRTRLYNGQISLMQTPTIINALSGNPSPDVMKIWKLIAEAQNFQKIGDTYASISTYDNLIDEFGDHNDVAVQAQVAYALSLKGVALIGLEKFNEAIKSFDEIVRKFQSSADAAIQERVAKAIRNKGGALIMIFHMSRDQTDLDKAIAFLDQVVIDTPLVLYNRACAAALSGDEQGCQKFLLSAKAHRTLPDKDFMASDNDLGAVRDTVWFVSFIAQLN